MFIGREMELKIEFDIASDINKVELPISMHENKWTCCLEVLKIMRDKIGIAIPINAIGPQKAVVKPVNAEEIKIK